MRQVGAFEAKNTLGTLLNLVMQGEEIVITRHGKPVARLVREPSREEKQARALRAAAEIERLAKGVTLGGHSLKELIEEGRS